MPGSGGGSEPSLAIADRTTSAGAAGTRYVSWQVPGEFARSVDGVNFTQMTTPDAGAGGDVTNAVSFSGALYNGQICGGATTLHTCIYRSLNGGTSWVLRNNHADMHPGAADRPWIDVYPKKSTATATNPDNDRVYLEFHTFSPEDQVYVTTSTDGGTTFGPPIPIETGTNAALADSHCNTIPGGIIVDQDNGRVYALWLSGDQVVQNVATGCNYTQIGPFTKAWVSVSSDGGTTWTSSLAWHGAYNPTTNIGDNAGKIFSTITIDDADQVHIGLSVRHNDDPLGYVAECEDPTAPPCLEDPNPTDFYLVTSPDIHLVAFPAGVAHWTLPFKVNKTSGSFFFPWLHAGSAGIVDAAYYSSTSLQPNNPTSIWFAGFSQVRGAVATYTSGANATYTATPVATDQILLDPNRVHGNGTAGGGLCTYGLFCLAVPGSNRNLADVFEVHLDPVGGANVTWTTDNGGNKIEFACQSSGASAYAGAPDLNGCYGPTDIAIAKSDTPDPVPQNQNLTYHLTVTNTGTPAGPATTNGVTVTDTLPSGVSYVSATPSTGSCSGTTTITCALGIFPSGASATVDIVVNVAAAQGTTLANTATVSATTSDPDASDNTATTTTLVAGPTAVRIRSATAIRTSRGVLLRWRVVSRAGLLGFNVYRQQGAQRLRLNKRLIAATTAGGRYAWLDRRPLAGRTSRYWLQEVRLDGTRAWYGAIIAR